MNFQIEPAARLELEEAAEWYGAIRPALGAEFLAEFDRSVQMILQAPNAWHPVGGGLRRYRLDRFPYGIIYHAHTGGVLVIAVAHLHRHPDYWRRRVAP
jgi:plasmid stabilization system protein ParE